MGTLRQVRALAWRSGVTDAEVAAVLPGDDLVPDATFAIDRACTLDTPPDAAWPWLVQLGKQRAGWYLPRRLEVLLPRGKRALRHLDQTWQSLAVGDDVADWGPGAPVLRAMTIDAPHALAYLSLRDRKNRLRWPVEMSGDVLAISWTLVLTDLGGRSRLHIRLRIRAAHRVLAAAGGLFDWLTIAGLFAGLRERVRA